MDLFSSSRPVLVTGASGFLGQQLATHLAARGAAVAGTFTSMPPPQLARVDLVPLPLGDPGPVRRLVRDLRPAAIFHLAAVTDANRCEREPEAAAAVNVAGTEALVAAVEEFAPDTPLVFTSTDLVFDGEAAPYSPDDEAKPLSAYGGQKIQAEAAVRRLPAGIVVRAALMVGPPVAGRGGFLAWMRGRLAAGETLDLFTDEVRTPVYTADLCGLLAALAAEPAPGIWHAGGPDRLTRVAMGEAVCEVFGLDSGLIRGVALADASTSAPRPRDVSLESGATWGRAGLTPRGFREALEEIRRTEASGSTPTR